MSAWGKRSRSCKDLSASFSKLSRIVSEIKSKRKSLSARHNLVVELMASPPFPAFPLFPVVPSVPAPQNPKLSATLPLQSPQSPKLSASLPLQSPQNPNLSTSAPPSQTTQNPKSHVTLPSEILPSATQVPISAKSTVNGNSLQLSDINPAQVSGSIPTQVSGGSPAHLFSMEKKSLVSPFPSTAVHSGKQAAKPTFWAVLLLAFLCTFLCTGKEIAVGITIAAYLVIWFRLRLGFVAKQSISNPAPLYYHEEHHVPARGVYRAIFSGQNRPLNRSSTIPPHRGGTFPSSSPSSRLTTRSKSLPRLHGSVQEELQSSEPGSSVDSASSVCSGIPSSRRIEASKFSARLKLQMMLLLVLCGLVHGRIMAVCMASCCILILSKVQRLVFRRS